jgi:hypothetical protein
VGVVGCVVVVEGSVVDVVEDDVVVVVDGAVVVVVDGSVELVVGDVVGVVDGTSVVGVEPVVVVCDPVVVVVFFVVVVVVRFAGAFAGVEDSFFTGALPSRAVNIAGSFPSIPRLQIPTPRALKLLATWARAASAAGLSNQVWYH